MLQYTDENEVTISIPEEIVILDCPQSWLVKPGDLIKLEYAKSINSTYFILLATTNISHCKNIGLTLKNLKELKYVKTIEKYNKMKAFL